MTTIPVAASAGHDIHVGPHDLHCSDGSVWPLASAEADIRVDSVVDHGRVVVVMGHLLVMGHVVTALRIVVYDRDDLVEAA